eukprot:1139018-Pelagomonas_calceolata.AAC.7
MGGVDLRMGGDSAGTQDLVAPAFSKSYTRIAAVCEALAEHAEAAGILRAGIAMQEHEADKVCRGSF